MNRQKTLLDFNALRVVELPYDMPQWTKKNESQIFLCLVISAKTTYRTSIRVRSSQHPKSNSRRSCSWENIVKTRSRREIADKRKTNRMGQKFKSQRNHEKVLTINRITTTPRNWLKKHKTVSRKLKLRLIAAILLVTKVISQCLKNRVLANRSDKNSTREIVKNSMRQAGTHLKPH